MRVLHISPVLGRTAFGLGPVVLNLAVCQQAAGTQADIWTADSPAEIRWTTQTNSLLGDSITSFVRRGPASLVYVPAMEKAATSSPGRAYDILHQHGIWTGLSRVTHKWKKAYGHPTVITPHGSLEKWAVNKSAWKKRLALLAYEGDNLRCADCLHVVAEMEANDVRDFGLRNPVAVIPNGISIDWLQSTGDAETWRSELGISQDTRLLLYLGRITPKKGLLMLVEAMNLARNHLDGWMLVIAGSDEHQHQADVQRLVSEYRLEQVVRFVGSVFGKDKRDLFAAAEVLVLPSVSEGAPMVILEALAVGLPVIATKASPWLELVTQRCGWWTEISREGIHDALLDMLQSSPDQLKEMGRKGQELIAAKYTWPRIAPRTLLLYDWLLGRGPRPDFVILD